ncbi:MAG: histidine kinase, partial [Flavisolibacter sp.]
MRQKLFFCIIFFQLSHFVDAQQSIIDSILLELNKPMADSNRAMSMMRLGVNYEAIDTTKAYQAYNEAISFAENKKLYYELGRTYQNLSFLFRTTVQYEKALASIDKSISFYQRSQNVKAKLWEANAYNDKATILQSQNETGQAVELYLKGISILEELQLYESLVTKYCNLANILGNMEEDEKQLKYSLKALDAAKKSGKRQGKFIAYFTLTNFYNRQQDGTTAKKFLDSTRVYFDESDNADNIDILFSFYAISAQVFRIVDQLDSALYYFRKSYEVSNAYNYNYGKAESQLQMGAVSILQKNYPEAENYLLSGIEQAKAINYFGMLDEGYKYLSDVYAVTGRYKEAYDYLWLYKEFNDSVMNLDSKKYSTELEKKYESEKKDKQIKLQQAQLLRRKTLNYVSIGAAAALLIVSLLTYRNYKQRQKIQQQRISELEKTKQLTATEAILKGEEQERSRLAKDLHDGLGGMMSGIKYSLLTMKKNQIMTPENQLAFERSIDMLDSSINEMRRVAHNMMPEALVKFGLDTALNDFCNDVNQTGALLISYQSIG